MVEHETIETVKRRPSTRMRMTAIERRIAIIAAARTEFARVGYQGASTASIARRAACSEPMLYKHFSGKRTLFLAALEAAATRIQLRFDELFATIGDRDARELARELVAEHLRDEEYQDLLRLRLLAISLADDPEVRDAVIRADSASRERIAQLISAGQTQGTLRRDVDPRFTAHMWMSLAFTNAYDKAFAPDSGSNLEWLADNLLAAISV